MEDKITMIDVCASLIDGGWLMSDREDIKAMYGFNDAYMDKLMDVWAEMVGMN